MTMKKYECEPCGYIYDPAVGDPDAGIDPETAFEDIPDDWTCPICGLGKDVTLATIFHTRHSMTGSRRHRKRLYL